MLEIELVLLAFRCVGLLEMQKNRPHHLMRPNMYKYFLSYLSFPNNPIVISWVRIYECIRILLMNIIKRNRIKSGRVVDIHMSDYETAMNFGRKKVIVQIIKSKG